MPDIHSVIAAHPALGGMEVVEHIKDGPLSSSWRVDFEGRSAVMRVDTPLAGRLGMDRHGELEVLRAVGAAGIGPEPLWADADAGILLPTFLEGTAWTPGQISPSDHLGILATLLRRLRELPVAGPAMDLGRYAQAYAARIGSESARRKAVEVATGAERIVSSGPRSICHGDPTHGNLIGRNPAFLIDWEFAVVGDPMLDVAVVVCEYDLPDSLAQEFMEACIGGSDAAARGRLREMCALYTKLAELWEAAIARG